MQGSQWNIPEVLSNLLVPRSGSTTRVESCFEQRWFSPPQHRRRWTLSSFTAVQSTALVWQLWVSFCSSLATYRWAGNMLSNTFCVLILQKEEGICKERRRRYPGTGLRGDKVFQDQSSSGSEVSQLRGHGLWGLAVLRFSGIDVSLVCFLAPNEKF